MRCIYVHHVTNGDDFSAGLVWHTEKCKAFHSPLACFPPQDHGHSFLHSFLFPLFDFHQSFTDLQQPLCALGQSWNVSVTVHLALWAPSGSSGRWVGFRFCHTVMSFWKQQQSHAVIYELWTVWCIWRLLCFNTEIPPSFRCLATSVSHIQLNLYNQCRGLASLYSAVALC